MLRRLDGPVCAVRAEVARDLHGFPSRTSDWAQQNMRIDTDSRVEMLRLRRHEREAKEEEDMKTKAEQAAALAEKQAKLSRAGTMQQCLADEAEKRRQQNASWDAMVQQARSSSTEMRALRQQCLVAQVSADRKLQVLVDQVAEEQEHQDKVATRTAEKIEKLRAEQGAMDNKIARRSAEKEFLETLSEQAASRLAKQRVQVETDRREERALADAAAARVRDEDLQRLAKHHHDQTKLHAALDQLVGERDRQRCQEATLDIKQVLEAEEFDRKKEAFAFKLALERKSAEESRQHVLRELARALHANQLKAEEVQQLCENVRFEELQLNEREQEESSLRQSLERKMACIHAFQESMRLLEERRLDADKEEQRERQELLSRFAEDAKLEQLGEQQRRMKKLAYAREIDQLLRERRQRDEEKNRREWEQIQAQKIEEERAAMIIEEERCRLLEAYGLYASAAKLRQLLGRGVRIQQ